MEPGSSGTQPGQLRQPSAGSALGDGERKGFRISVVSPCSEANRFPWYEEKGWEMQGQALFPACCLRHIYLRGHPLAVFDSEPPGGRVQDSVSLASN